MSHENFSSIFETQTLERYQVVTDISVREPRIMKQKWQQGNRKRREKKQKNVLLNAQALSLIPENYKLVPSVQYGLIRKYLVQGKERK